ncbi:unnamed protein product [Triticum turgidum subsp. durum]|uniref:Uncharacterized protein n=1 Tax=Triticum turgidum subsp. durum TaxID=4567 RepID=A0A9R1PUU5_TRITD|nr:unnamed protein product [Triticum turgidum subsp. durum]
MDRHDLGASGEIEKTPREAAAPDMESEPAAARAAERVPPWREQVTVRGMVAALLIGVVYTVIVMKLSLTTGLVPTLNVSAALLAFLALRGWTHALHRLGIACRPFTRQENTVVQTCAVACYTIGFGGGFGSFLLGLDKKTYELSGVNTPGNVPGSYKDPGIGWMMGFLLAISFVGLLTLLPLRKAFLCIALLIGDGFYNFLKVILVTLKSIHEKSQRGRLNRVADEDSVAIDDLQRNEVFNRDNIPAWVAYAGYALLSAMAVVAIPLMFREVKWYFVVIAYLLAPALGFCNAYGTGLTDMNMGYNYGKVALFVFAAWAGKDNGVVAGLVTCGLVKQLVLVSADLMHDFKTAHLTLTSPRSMLVGQAVGTLMGCVVAPLTFFLFYEAFDVGNPDGYWKAPYALIYRNMAILGVEGFSALPQHCLQLCAAFFAFAVLANLARDFLPGRFGRFVPLPMAMAVPFLVGASFAIDMCVGSLVVFLWHKLDGKKAALLIPAVASGLICGDGIWIFPSSLLALAKIKPPMCMKFTPGS